MQISKSNSALKEHFRTGGKNDIKLMCQHAHNAMHAIKLKVGADFAPYLLYRRYLPPCIIQSAPCMSLQTETKATLGN